MSFGVGIGDIITVSTLAWRLFKSCKDASGDFKNVASEVVSLHVVLKETEELVAESDLGSSPASQLQHIADGCRSVLEDLEGLLAKYQSLGTKSQRTWDRMKWGSEAVTSVRTRLISNTTMLSAYNTTMVNSSVSRIERQLNRFMEEVRSGKREGSVISNGTEILNQEEGDEGWLQLRRELEDMGVSADILSQHKHFVVDWFQKALTEDQNGGKHEFLQISEISNAEEKSDSIPQRPKPSFQDSRVPTLGILTASPSFKNTQATIAKDILIRESSLYESSRGGDLDAVDYLLRHGVNVNYKSGTLTALGIAAMGGHAPIVQRLLNEPDIKVNLQNYLGHTPLSLASWYGHFAVVQLLLDDPTTAIDPNDEEEGQTPLSLAVEQGNTSIVLLLLAKGANPNSQDRKGRTPLMWAVKKGRSEETKLLLAASQIMPNRSDSFGLSPLAQAVECGNNAIVRLLLAHPDVDINTPDRHMMTPIDRVKRYGDNSMMFFFDQARARRELATPHSTSATIEEYDLLIRSA